MVRWLVVALASVEAAYMVFDGVHALTRGDYVTPMTGEYAGQLGPWAGIVTAVGVDPRSVPMKWLFVVYGVAWLAIIVAFVRDGSSISSCVMVCADRTCRPAMPDVALTHSTTCGTKDGPRAGA